MWGALQALAASPASCFGRKGAQKIDRHFGKKQGIDKKDVLFRCLDAEKKYKKSERVPGKQIFQCWNGQKLGVVGYCGPGKG